MASVARGPSLAAALEPFLRALVSPRWVVAQQERSQDSGARVRRVLVVFRLSRSFSEPGPLDLQTVRRAVEAERGPREGGRCYFELPEDFFDGPASVLLLLRALCVCLLLAEDLACLFLLLRTLEPGLLGGPYMDKDGLVDLDLLLRSLLPL